MSRHDLRRPVDRSRMLPEYPGNRDGRAPPCGFPFSKVSNEDLNCWDPKQGVDVERLTPMEDFKEVQIGLFPIRRLRYVLHLLKKKNMR